MSTNRSLSDRVMKGAFWVAFNIIVARVFQFGASIVVARTVEQDAIGLHALMMVFMGLMAALTSANFRAAFIYHRFQGDEARRALDSLFCINAVRGFLLFGAFWLLGPALSAWYGRPEILHLSRFLCIGYVIGGLTNVGTAMFEMDVKLRTPQVGEAVSRIVAAVATVIFALYIRTVWALAFAYIVTRVSDTVMTYVIHPYRPSFRFDKALGRKLITYGKFLTVTAILGYLVSSGDDAVVGKVLGTKALSHYAVAFSLTFMISSCCLGVFSRVSFPAFSEVAGDLPRFREAFVHMVRAGTYLALPLMVGLLCVAREGVLTCYGEKWLPAVVLVRLFCVPAAMRVVSASLTPALRALGKPNVDMWLVALRLVLLAAGVVVFIGPLRTVGVCLAVVLSAVVVYSLRWGLVLRALAVPVGDVVRGIRVPVIACCGMGLALLLRRYWALPGLSPAWALLADVALGGTAYVGIATALNLLGADGFFKDVRDRVWRWK
jgi:PST family polysaccharide transporter/lipopolysaccharide exporter